ncbi:MAG: hypothetical protein IAC42_02530 [Spirochaetes bacterium]|uniref:Uncharacterized protein n=1 Tax=Candidatus Aphodenecus pullistercoris TaxID=2840669 RepID=A0A9D9E782_9SPIR|nr:hypothetical protein [Candidatus Aphodenecus pullistercoris]
MSYSNLTAIPNEADMAMLSATLREGFSILPAEVDIGIAPEAATLTLSYGASKLLAVGSAVATGRTRLIVYNKGPAQIKVGKSSESAIYEDGIPIEPGQRVIFRFDAEASTPVQLYGRSMGYKCEVEIAEV